MADYIDRQAAIDFIDTGHFVNPNEPRWSDNEVVNFLKSRPSADVQPAEVLTETDYTELRDRFGEYVEFVVRDMISKEGKRWETTSTGTKDVQPVRRGHWEKIGKPTWWGLYECSECHKTCSVDYTYCPHCGSIMKEKKND